ncbi:GNAT family N-acetyltransferase [Brevundimonas sp. UBA5866]|nr:GNAT family N-acetyltransferase [Brevundimonas sp. UBA5866]
MPELRAVFDARHPLDDVGLRLVATFDDCPVAFIELNGNHIENLFVRAAWQGKGVGTALLEEAEQMRAGDMTLSVFHANPRARSLYERHGYRVVEDREINYHGSRQSVWFMRKTRQSMPRHKAVIFDFDGVLVDSREWMVKTLIQLSDEFGLQPLNEQAVEKMRGMSNREILGQMKVPLWKLPAMMKRGRKLAALAGNDIHLVPGAEPALRALQKSGFKLGLVTSNSRTRVEQTLGHDIMALFHHIECGASLFGKARRLTRTCRFMDVKPSEAVYVGDESRDVEAALTAGLTPVSVAWGYAHADILIQAGTSEVIPCWDALQQSV